MPLCADLVMCYSNERNGVSLTLWWLLYLRQALDILILELGDMEEAVRFVKRCEDDRGFVCAPIAKPSLSM